MSKRFIAFILLIVAILLVGCGSHHQVAPSPTPVVSETPAPTPTTKPFPVTPSPSPTITPTPSPSPTVMPTVTPVPTIAPSIFPVITKSPTDETVNEGGECYFVARYENATIAVWHFVSPDGQTDLTYIGAQEQFKPVEIIDGMYSTLHLKNIPYSLNGWKVYCKYSNSNGSAVTKMALITVIPAPAPTIIPAPTATPVPTIEPTPVPTPIPTIEPTPIPTPIPTVEPTPTPEPTVEPTSTPEPTFVPSPDGQQILKDEFEKTATEWAEKILDTYKEAEEEAKEKEEEFVNENYLTEYEIDTETFTLTITYDVTEQMLDNIKNNIDIKRYEDKKEITLAESTIELLDLNFEDIQNMEHCIIHLMVEDEEYYTLDLITNEIIYVKRISE